MSNHDNNIFEPQFLLEAIISGLKTIEYRQERLDQRQDSIQKAIAKLRADLVESGVLKLK